MGWKRACHWARRYHYRAAFHQSERHFHFRLNSDAAEGLYPLTYAWKLAGASLGLGSSGAIPIIKSESDSGLSFVAAINQSGDPVGLLMGDGTVTIKLRNIKFRRNARIQFFCASSDNDGSREIAPKNIRLKRSDGELTVDVQKGTVVGFRITGALM